MMKHDMTRPLSRRALLGLAGRLGVAAATIAALPVSLARAASHNYVNNQKLSQKSAMYQDHPKGNQQCSTCAQFVAPNQCKLVAGDISPKGWCVFFAPKQNSG